MADMQPEANNRRNCLNTNDIIAFVWKNIDFRSCCYVVAIIFVALKLEPGPETNSLLGLYTVSFIFYLVLPAIAGLKANFNVPNRYMVC